MKSFVGNICSADSDTKTFEVSCVEGISGVTIWQRVLIIPIGDRHTTEWGHIQDRLAQYNLETMKFPEES